MAAQDSASELVLRMADDSFIGDAEENACQIMAVGTPPTPRRKSNGQRPMPESSGQDLCFLCELPGDLHKFKASGSILVARRLLFATLGNSPSCQMEKLPARRTLR